MKTIVILGAGVAAVPLIRQLMRTVVLKSDEYRLTVVAPNTHFLWPVAMPRAVVPGQYADDKVMMDLRPIFKEWPSDRFEFVVGTAGALEPEKKSVTVSLGDSSGSRSIEYHTVIVATGSSARERMPWKTVGDTQQTKAQLSSLREGVAAAKTIVVAGGGTTGVEVAGELAYEYAKGGAKEVYLVFRDSLPLASPIPESVRRTSLSELRSLGVKLVPDTTVVSSSSSSGEVELQLRNVRDGSTRSLTAQAYLPTMGLVPNSAFVPARMLDGDGYVLTTTQLRAEGYDNVFVVGDVGNLEPNKAAVADAQTGHLIKALPVYFRGGRMPEYRVASQNINVIAVGRSRGTGHMGSLRMWSCVSYYLKGRYLGTDAAPHVAAGKRSFLTTFEK